MRIAPIDQTRGILALLVKNEGRVLLADEIVAVFQNRIPRATVYKRLNKLQDAELVERIWNHDMPMPRFGVSDAGNARLLPILADIVKEAGPSGITEDAANDHLLRRVMNGALI